MHGLSGHIKMESSERNSFQKYTGTFLFSVNFICSLISELRPRNLKTIFPPFSREAISQKEIVFRFRKDIQSEKGWRFDILCMRSPGVKGICADALLCDSLSCQSLRFVVEARYSTEPIQWEKEEL